MGHRSPKDWIFEGRGEERHQAATCTGCVVKEVRGRGRGGKPRSPGDGLGEQVRLRAPLGSGLLLEEVSATVCVPACVPAFPSVAEGVVACDHQDAAGRERMVSVASQLFATRSSHVCSMYEQGPGQVVTKQLRWCREPVGFGAAKVAEESSVVRPQGRSLAGASVRGVRVGDGVFNVGDATCGTVLPSDASQSEGLHLVFLRHGVDAGVDVEER